MGAGVFSFCKVAIVVIAICMTWTQTGEDRRLQFGLIHEMIAKHNIQVAWHYDDFMQNRTITLNRKASGESSSSMIKYVGDKALEEAEKVGLDSKSLGLTKA